MEIKRTKGVYLTTTSDKLTPMIEDSKIVSIKSLPQVQRKLEIEFANGLGITVALSAVKEIITSPDTQMVVVDHVKDGYSHIISKDIDLLHEFAKKMGVNRKAFHNSPRHPHYDLRAKDLYSALKYGAILCTSKNLVTWYNTGVLIPSYSAAESIVHRVNISGIPHGSELGITIRSRPVERVARQAYGGSFIDSLYTPGNFMGITEAKTNPYVNKGEDEQE